MSLSTRDDLAEKALRSLSALPRPFLRWAGSKQRLLPQIVPRLPHNFGTYYEPFLGAGSLFFLLKPDEAVIGDRNSRLIETYESIRDAPSTVQEYLQHLDPLDKEQYYEVRRTTCRGRHQRAAQFIYLNRSCWNGLYRVNSSGKFNVPYGSPRSANLVDWDVLRSCSEALNKPGVQIVSCDFAKALQSAQAGDLVFLDPPYVTGHDNNGFIDYNEELFGWHDQVRLASLSAELQASGVNVLITNAHHTPVIDLYPRFNVDVLSRHSTLAGAVARRRRVQEVLLWQRPTPGGNRGAE